MIAVNRDIMIRSFALLFAFAFFTAQSAAAGDVVLAANEILLNLTIVAAPFSSTGLPPPRSSSPAAPSAPRHRPAFERSLRLIVSGASASRPRSSLFLWLAGPAIDRRDDDQRQRARRGADISSLCGARAGRRHARLPDGRRFHRRDLVGDMRNMMLLSLAVYLVAWCASRRSSACRPLDRAAPLPRLPQRHPLLAHAPPRRAHFRRFP